MFTDGHEDEILGTFHVFNVKPGLIICSAFTSLGNKYGRFKVDENALLKVLRKIERQVKYYNEHYGKNQTVHFPYSFTTVELLTENGEQRTVKEYVDMVFGESPVEVYIHKAN